MTKLHRWAQIQADKAAQIQADTGAVLAYGGLDRRSGRVGRWLVSLGLLTQHPAVYDAAVSGVPDEEFGEVAKAVVHLRDPARAGAAMAQELVDFCLARLGRLKLPRTVVFDNPLPRLETGKPAAPRTQGALSRPPGRGLRGAGAPRRSRRLNPHPSPFQSIPGRRVSRRCRPSLARKPSCVVFSVKTTNSSVPRCCASSSTIAWRCTCAAS